MTDLNPYYKISEYIAAYIADEDKAIAPELELWIAARPENKSIFEKLVQEAAVKSLTAQYHEINVAEAWNKVNQQLFEQPAANKSHIPTLKFFAFGPWFRIAGNAAAFAAIVFGIWFFLSPGHLNDRKDLSKYDIPAPKGNHATITLGNGKTLNLNNTKTGIVIDATKLTYNDGTKIALETTQPRSDVVITTPRGGQYTVTLPDGTVAQLNSATTLTFPSSFAKLKERSVQLVGEAYFTVSHNAKQPFKVISKGQVVEDIGTEFNISAYPDENAIKTTLAEGSARVNNVILIPGNQSIVKGKTLTVQTVNLDDALAWKNGYFLFNDENITSIMNKLSRWYNVDIQYQGNITTEGFNGIISRNKNISQVLSILQKTKGVHFKIEGRRVTVMQ